MQKNYKDNQKSEEFELLAQKIEKATNILIFTHKNPDIDAIGSVMAVSRFLSHNKKAHKVFLSAPLPERFFYLKEDVKILDTAGFAREFFDLVIGLDCSNLEWSGAEEILSHKKAEGVFFINIDHHANSNYADVNIVDKGKSATALLLYDIFDLWGVKIDERMATQFLAGIIADTNCFTNGATSAEAYLVAGELLRLGARYNNVVAQFQKSDSEGWFGLWSKLLSRLTKNDKIKLAYSVILSEDLGDGGGTALEGAANFLSNLTGIRMAMILKENINGEIKVSLRSIDSNINVAEMANFFGGGGHARSAGFSVKGRLEREGNYWQII